MNRLTAGIISLIEERAQTGEPITAAEIQILAIGIRRADLRQKEPEVVAALTARELPACDQIPAYHAETPGQLTQDQWEWRRRSEGRNRRVVLGGTRRAV